MDADDFDNVLKNLDMDNISKCDHTEYSTLLPAYLLSNAIHRDGLRVYTTNNRDKYNCGTHVIIGDEVIPVTKGNNASFLLCAGLNDMCASLCIGNFERTGLEVILTEHEPYIINNGELIYIPPSCIWHSENGIFIVMVCTIKNRFLPNTLYQEIHSHTGLFYQTMAFESIDLNKPVELSINFYEENTKDIGLTVVSQELLNRAFDKCEDIECKLKTGYNTLTFMLDSHNEEMESQVILNSYWLKSL